MYTKIKGASILTSSITKHKTPESFIKSLDGQIPDLVENRKEILTGIWKKAKGKPAETV